MTVRGVLAILTAALAPAAAAEQLNGFDLSDTLIPRAEIFQGGPPRDGIPALTDPKFMSAAAADFLKNDDHVLGIAFAGAANLDTFTRFSA